jgi:hypothetical protein
MVGQAQLGFARGLTSQTRCASRGELTNVAADGRGQVVGLCIVW